MNDIYKLRAERLGAFLATRHGCQLKHTSLLEAIAAEEGARNWHTLRVRTSLPETLSRPTHSTAMRFDTFAECKDWTIECLHQAETRFLLIANAKNSGWHLFHSAHSGERKLVAYLTDGQAAELCEYLGAQAGLRKEDRQPQEGNFVSTRKLNGVWSEVPLTLCTLPTLDGTHFVLRANRPSRFTTMTSLDMSAATAWLDAVTQGPPLTVIAGASGSGRTTTLTATTLALDGMPRETCFITACPAELSALTTLASHCSVLVAQNKGLAKPLKAARALSPTHVIVDCTPLSQEAAAKVVSLLRTGVRVSVSVCGGSASGVIRTLRELGLNPEALGMPVGILCQTMMTEKSKDDAHPSRKLLASDYREVTPEIEGNLEALPFPDTAFDAIHLLEQGRISYPTFVRAYGVAGIRHLPEHLRQS
jgi:hypothetical protein